MAGFPHRISTWIASLKKPSITTLDLPSPKRESVAAEEIAPQLFSLTTGDAEDPAFRRITSPATLRDLNPLMHDRMLQVCYFLAVTTPFGKRIVEIISDFVVGKRNSIRVTAKDKAVQDVINEFWDDPYNKMGRTVREWCNEQTTFGELCIPVVVNKVSGQVRIGYIDPMNIESVQYAEMTSQGGTVAMSFPYGVRVRREVGQPAGPVLQIIRKIEDPNDENFGRLRGDCFYDPINKAKSASRGFSELFSLADWIDVFDQMIFDFADKVRFLNSLVWHYTVEGADEKRAEDFKDRLTKDPPRQGGVQVTNEKVKIEAKTPDFKGQDMAEGARMVKLYGLGGAGLPAWFFADPVDANRSTAQEMSGPTGKKIEARQGAFGELLGSIIDFVIDCAIQAGRLPENVDRTFSTEFPEVTQRDLKEAALAMQAATPGIVIASQEGWIRTETAARAYHKLLAPLGVDIDDSKIEFQEAQKETQDRAARQQNDLNPQSNLQNALDQLPPADQTVQ
jgi:hypothetical protein